jgi:hypothetical protein
MNNFKATNIQTLSFNGMEPLTDIVFYIIHQNFKENKIMWRDFEPIKLDSCRYITDFGIELLNEVIGEKNIITPETCCGCEKLFKTLHVYENDIFTSKTFTKCFHNDQISLKTFKLLIINDTDINMISFLRSNDLVKRDMSKFIYDFDSIQTYQEKEMSKKVAKKASAAVVKEFNLNVFEVNKVSLTLTK